METLDLLSELKLLRLERKEIFNIKNQLESEDDIGYLYAMEELVNIDKKISDLERLL